jgi:arylsulfatase A-like enzyme
LLSSLRTRHEQDQPFFLFLHHYLCHDPYLAAPRRIRQRFLKDPEPGLPFDWSDLDPDQRSTEGSSIADIDSRFFEKLSLHDSFWQKIDGGNPRHRRHVRALYDAGIHHADRVFGEILALLKREGLFDQALIVVLSDHGEEFWEHGGTLHQNLFIETLHVPLLVRFPGGEHGGRKIETPVAQFDLMPTLLEYLGIAPRRPIQAVSLLPQILGKSVKSRQVISFDDSLEFVRFQLGSYSYSSQRVRGAAGDWLYNHLSDPGEKRNLAPLGGDRLQLLRTQASWIMDKQAVFRSRIGCAPPSTGEMPEELKRQLEALGYL